MLDIALAIAPVFLLILLGYGLEASGFLKRPFWDGAERLTYFVLFPVLLFTTLAKAEFGSLEVANMAGAMAAAVVVLAAGLALLRRTRAVEPGAFTSLFQGSIRFNTYIGLAVAAGTFGTAGLSAAAVAVAILVPVGNLLSILALTRQGPDSKVGVFATLFRVVSNPLVVACALGLVVNFTGLRLPEPVAPLLEITARAALPLGLLAVGAGLEFAALQRGGLPLGLACVLKLAVLPAITLGTCWMFDVSGLAVTVAVLFNALPTAPSSYVLARQLGGDAKLMASIITAQIPLAAFTLPLVLVLLG